MPNTYSLFHKVRMQEDPAQQLCNELEINPSAVQKHIEKLKAANVIKRHGGANGGHWEILI